MTTHTDTSPNREIFSYEQQHNGLRPKSNSEDVQNNVERSLLVQNNNKLPNIKKASVDMSQLPEDYRISAASDTNTRVNENGFTYNEPKPTLPKKLSEGFEGSDSSSGTKKFVKLKAGGEQDSEPLKAWDEDINYTFAQAKENFIGQFQTNEYKVVRGYLDGNGVQLRLYYTKVEPFGRKVASLCIIHGLGEHSGRYMEMADHFAKHGFIVHLIDLRGFGHSGFARANATAEEMHRDIEVLLKQANRNLPLFLYAHSMGVALTSSLLIRNPHLNIAGVIFTSGLFGFPKWRDMNFAKKFFIKALGDHLGEVIVNVMINPTSLTRNNYNVKKLFDDRLAIPIIGIRMAKTLVQLVDYVLPNTHKFRYPCLVIHGNADTVTEVEDSIKFYKKASSEDKTLRIFEGGYHELQYDHDKELLKKTISDWLLERVGRSPQNLGELPPLRVGLVRKDAHKNTKIMILIILVLLYFLFLKKFRGHKLYSTSLSVLFFPLFYIKNVLSGAHGWKLQ